MKPYKGTPGPFQGSKLPFGVKIRAAKSLRLGYATVKYFCAGHPEKAGPGASRKIRRWLRANGYLPKRKSPERCVCPTCSSNHVEKNSKENDHENMVRA